MAAQDDVLKVLATKDGPVSAKDIATEIKSTNPTVTTLLWVRRRKGER